MIRQILWQKADCGTWVDMAHGTLDFCVREQSRLISNGADCMGLEICEQLTKEQLLEKMRKTNPPLKSWGVSGPIDIDYNKTPKKWSNL